MPGQGLGLGVKGLADFGNPAALGRRVRRYGQALALDLGTAAFNIFEINAGDIMLTSLYGIVTTAITSGGAPVPGLEFTPDSNTPAGLTPMCLAAATIATDAIDTIYCWVGTVGGQLAPATGVGIGIASFGTNVQILAPGIISVTNAGDMCTAGVIDWVLHYVPLDTDSVVVPVYA